LSREIATVSPTMGGVCVAVSRWCFLLFVFLTEYADTLILLCIMWILSLALIGYFTGLLRGKYSGAASSGAPERAIASMAISSFFFIPMMYQV
jgi:hypothetical protein